MSKVASQKKRLRVLVGTGAAHGVNIALSELDEAGLDKVVEHGDEIRAAVIQTITTKARELSVSGQFRDEEVKSSYGYLSGYKKPKGITEQTNILRQLFPGIGFADEKLAERELPENAEGWFAIPKWQTMAPTYGEAVEKVFEAIKKSRNGKFYNYRDGELGPKNLRQSQKSAKMFQKLGDEQKDHDILIVPAQFGLRHRGRSVRRALEVMSAGEFGFGAFAVGIMLLTHPDRLNHYDDLWIDCAGDEFSPGAVGEFSDAAYFGFYGGKVRFGTKWSGHADGNFGSASGFLPQV